MKKQERVRAYTTRAMPVDYVDRLRIEAAKRSKKSGDRVTIEAMMNRAIQLGLTILEKESV